MELHLFLWFTALVIILALTSYFMLRIPGRGNRTIQKKRLPPEAAGGWPLIGHLLALWGPELPHITLSNMVDKYGPIFTIRLGVQRVLIVSSWEVVKDCFTTNDIIFSNRSKTAATQHLSYNFAMLGFNDYGSYWREVRKISMEKLLSSRRVSMLGKLYETEIRAMMRPLYNSCFKNGENVQVEMKKFFGDLTLNLMVRIVTGDRENMDIDLGGNEKWREAIEEFFNMVTVLTIPDVLPFLKWLDYFGVTNKMFKKTGNEMDSLLQAWLDHKKHRRTCDSEQEEGFMAEMITVADRVAKEFPMFDADTICKATCQAMMIGGTDTMSVTLTWALCLLLNNRHTLKRAQEELDIHVGRERQVEESDLEKLIYMKAIIKETLRLQPPGALSPPRPSSEDCVVAGYHVPAGTLLIAIPWKLHRDPRVWSDPLEFQPERFLTMDTKRIDFRSQHFEWLPFGGGRRMCPGISFALPLMELALASLVHGFDIETPSNEAVDMTGSFAASNEKATPLEVLVTPRLSPKLYA